MNASFEIDVPFYLLGGRAFSRNSRLTFPSNFFYVEHFFCAIQVNIAFYFFTFPLSEHVPRFSILRSHIFLSAMVRFLFIEIKIQSSERRLIQALKYLGEENLEFNKFAGLKAL